MMEFKEVLINGPNDLGACPDCGCNGAMLCGTSNWKTGEYTGWFRCHRCSTDWVPVLPQGNRGD